MAGHSLGGFETGHAIVQIQPMIKEILDWFDKYLGPVTLR